MLALGPVRVRSSPSSRCSRRPDRRRRARDRRRRDARQRPRSATYRRIFTAARPGAAAGRLDPGTRRRRARPRGAAACPRGPEGHHRAPRADPAVHAGRAAGRSSGRRRRTSPRSCCTRSSRGSPRGPQRPALYVLRDHGRSDWLEVRTRAPTLPHDADSRRAPHHHPLRPQAPRLRPAGRPALLDECLEIALQAPTASNRQTWHFVVVTDPELKNPIADYYRQSFAAYIRPAAADDPERAKMSARRRTWRSASTRCRRT